MNSNWKKITLGKFIKLKRGYDLPRSKMKNGIYPVIGSNGIIGYHDKFTNLSPGVTLGRSGNVGKPYIINKKSWSHNTTLYVDDFKGANPYFVYYLLKTLNLGYYAEGSAVPTLNRNHINPILLKIPDIVVQKKIAYILGSLDKKIELSNELNQNLI